ncbi:hypothetical protein AK812_SmicGene7231 [Symbiodinium microadriaticum]|uniref:Uncharacterized protein n=1 Tax=Symbiodinium microadriaticum TaxID=2951 RepID=A0A1Q9EP37_SYMMI|nr:hypothetical protein AK812_SmicGene7231 [Symbiodinium microadriaticum]
MSEWNDATRGERPPVDELDEDDDADELDEDSLLGEDDKENEGSSNQTAGALMASMSMFHMAKQAKGQQAEAVYLLNPHQAARLLGYVELGLMGEEQHLAWFRYNKLVWQQLKEAGENIHNAGAVQI